MNAILNRMIKWIDTVDKHGDQGVGHGDGRVDDHRRMRHILPRTIFCWLREKTIDYFLLWHYLLPIVEKKKIHFYNRSKGELATASMSISVRWIVLPLLWTSIYGVRALLFLAYFYRPPQTQNWWSKYVLLAGSVYTYNSRVNIQVTLLMWALNLILLYVREFGRRLGTLNFLAIFVVRPNGDIRLKDLHLNLKNYQKLRRFRFVAIEYIYAQNVLISLAAFVVEVGLRVHTAAFYHNFFYSILSSIFIFLWSSSTCLAIYCPAAYIMVLVYYITLKQKNIISNLGALNQVCSRCLASTSGATTTVTKNVHRYTLHGTMFVARFVLIQRHAMRLNREIAAYERPWRYNLSILLMTYTMIIIYITYLIFHNNMPAGFKEVYRFVYVAHIAMLAMIVFACSRIPTNQRKMAHYSTRFRLMFTQHNVLRPPRAIRLDRITSTVEGMAIGFRLSNNYLIKTTSFFMIAYYLSNFYFLFFRGNDK